MSEQIQRPVAGPPARPMLQRPPAGALTISPKEIVDIIRRHILLIAVFTIIGFIVGGITWYLLRRFAPQYTALALIEVLPPSDQGPLEFGIVQPQEQYYYQLRSSKAGFIRQQNTLLELLKRPRIRETDWYRQFGDNDAEIITKAVRDLERRFGVGVPRDTTYIQLSMRCHSKAESALIVNEMLDMFLARQKEIATADMRNELAAKNMQQEALAKTLHETEEALQSIRTSSKFVSLDIVAFQTYMDRKLGELEVQNSNLTNEISELESIIEILRSRSEGDFDEVVREEMERDLIASDLKRQVNLLQAQLAQQMSRFGENHRRVRETYDTIKQMEESLSQRQTHIADIVRKSNFVTANDRLITSKGKLEKLRQQLQETQRAHMEMDHTRAQYQSAVAKRNQQQQLLNQLRDHIEQLKMSIDDPRISRVKPLGLAPEPLRISAPIWYFYFSGGTILGLLAGAALAFATELLNDLLRTPSDVMKHLTVPLLGTICHAEEDADISGVDLCHIVRQAPYSIMSECYRQFRTNLKLSGQGRTNKVLLVTSGQAGDGKTTVAVNLAATLIAEDKKVLLIDANFRRPSSTLLFPPTHANGSALQRHNFGLSNYLMGQTADSADTIRFSGIEGLDIIDCGPLPMNPAELLASEKMRQLFQTVRLNYDYAIIDAPALLVSDAKILAAQTDGTILVFNTDQTRRGAAQRAVRELREINAAIAGTVLVGIRSLRGGYFHEIYRSYQQYQKVQVAQPV